MRHSIPVITVDFAGAGIAPEFVALWSNTLAGHGIATGPCPQLRIILTADLNDPNLAQLCPTDRPALLVEPGRDYCLIGPLLLPGSLSCGRCLRHWLTVNRALDQHAAVEGISSCNAVAIDMAAALLTGGDAPRFLTDALVSVDATGRGVVHPLYPLRHCPECGHRARPAPLDGLGVHCSPLTGIISKMDLSAEPVGGLYHAAALFIGPPRRSDLPRLRAQRSYGRAGTQADAEVSCLAEALERYCLVYRGDEEVIHAPRGRLAGAIPPNDILLFSPRQYARRDDWNPTHSEFQHVPPPARDDDVLAWTPARRIAGGPSALVPAAHCFMWYEFAANEPCIALADSNGCAAGRTLEEAALSGLLELVERDAMAIWWYNRLRRPALPREELTDPDLQTVLDAFAAMDRPIHFLDITTDLGIPAVAAVSVTAGGAEPVFASAASWSRAQAARKAAWEVCQIWNAVLHRRECSQELAQWLVRANTAVEPWLMSAGVAPSATDQPSSLDATIARLRDHHLDPLLVDLSRPDVSIPVVRTIVPGLRHFWGRFGAGRLYDVPVRLGWLPETPQEDSLNPICCMI